MHATKDDIDRVHTMLGLFELACSGTDSSGTDETRSNKVQGAAFIVPIDLEGSGKWGLGGNEGVAPWG